MPERLFLDGTGITPGTEGCKCGPECEFSCWMRVGQAPACKACGCAPFEEDPTIEDLGDAVDILSRAANRPLQKETRTELGAQLIERNIPGIGTLEFFHADVGQWLTKKGEPAKKAKRTYTLHHQNGESVVMDAVSSVVGCLDKFALRGWYEDHGARGAVKAERLGELEGVPEEEIIQRVRSLGFGAGEQLSDASGRGQAVHQVFENKALDQPIPARDLFPSDWLPWYDGALLAWEALDPEPVEVEQIVCHPEDCYAGRFDLVARVNGELTLIDYKTGKGRIFREAHFQTRLYERARRRCGFEPCTRIVIVGVTDSGGFMFSEGDIVDDSDAEGLLRTFRTAGRVDRALAAQRKAAA